MMGGNGAQYAGGKKKFKAIQYAQRVANRAERERIAAINKELDEEEAQTQRSTPIAQSTPIAHTEGEVSNNAIA
jgi:hypothetical protein